MMVGLAVLVMAQAAPADWVPNAGDPMNATNHKMHFPQMPDPDGWDVDMTNFTLADDFLCTQTGPISDIHFWYSWQEDVVGQIVNIHASIHANIKADENPYGPWSMPGELLWEYDFGEAELVIAGPFPGYQGWDDPTLGSECIYPDHDEYWQMNITDIDEPFYQQEGEIYWLDLWVTVPVQAALNNGMDVEPLLGWKTTFMPWEDTAVYFVGPGGVDMPDVWEPIAVCWDDVPMDLAFVITPEPATLALLGLGGVVALLRRRSK